MSTAADEVVDAEGRKISLKQQKREYKDEKKRVAQEMLASLRDPTIIIMADWLKLRGTLHNWTRYFCVLKPGLMLIYKSDKTEKSGQWIRTVLLSACELIERPSRKYGFCFKLYHPMDLNIWATRGPLGESYGAVTLQPLPSAHLICRVPSVQSGNSWMDALQMALRYSGSLVRTINKLVINQPIKDGDANLSELLNGTTRSPRREMSEVEAEKHFSEVDDEDNDALQIDECAVLESDEECIYERSPPEQFGPFSNETCACQTEDLGDENKSIVWSLLKQIRPGMDLSRVTLPTFILEPRSFLEKLSDFYYHSNILAEAAAEDDPAERMKKVVKFYLSGFYKKPKGLKKPYNPILGEIYRCKWENPDGSNTYYIAEQVSHHPPVSSLFVSNRQAGFNVSGTISSKSKYYGNSLSALMIGTIKITLLNRDETYRATLPYANCKGLMIGTLTMEYGGEVEIVCNRTPYRSNLNFKLKPFLGGAVNVVSGAIRLGCEKLAKIEGKWDSDIYINENEESTLFWSPTSEVVKQRLQKYEISLVHQKGWESKRLWLKVSEAIANDDQESATNEKSILENAQRERTKSHIKHKLKYFKYDSITKTYEYAHADYRPWDDNDDLRQVEKDFIIHTISKCGLSAQSHSKTIRHSTVEDPTDTDGSSDVASPVVSRKLSLGRDRCIRQLQEDISRLMHVLLRIDERTENFGNFITFSQLLYFFAVFTVFQMITITYLIRSI